MNKTSQRFGGDVSLHPQSTNDQLNRTSLHRTSYCRCCSGRRECPDPSSNARLTPYNTHMTCGALIRRVHIHAKYLNFHMLCINSFHLIFTVKRRNNHKFDQNNVSSILSVDGGQPEILVLVPKKHITWELFGYRN